MPGTKFSQGKPYLSIVQGALVMPCEKGAPESRERAWEASDGSKGVKHEIVYQNWTGKILGITFKTGEYGESCYVELEDAILQLGTAGRYFKDFACKILSGDMKKEFIFHPYNMEVDGGKKVTGISIKQNGEKLKNYFYDYNTKTTLGGFPEVDNTKKEKKTYWKVYFSLVEEFLIEKLKEIQFDKSEKTTKDEPLEPFEAEVMKNELPWE